VNRQHVQALYHFADQYGVPRNIALALVRQESGGRPNARSPVGAEGYTQLMPGTAKGLGVNPRDPIDNLRGGMMYLGHLLQSFHGNMRYALAAYNAGPGAVRRYNGIPPYMETQNYVKNILAMAGPGQNNKQFTTSRLNAINNGLAQNSRIGALNPRLSDALAMASPTEASQSILGRLGGTAARASEAASAPIPLPASATGGGQGIPQLPGTHTLMPRVQIQGKITAADRKAMGLIQEAIGTPYVWGGSKPGGFDCSGLLQYYWGKVGVNIPRTTYDQWKTGQAVGKGQLRAGDAVFFHKTSRGPEHVGFYIGNGKFIEAPHTGAKVRISTLAGRKDYAGARRFA
jgi:cell wall-associated NlpC family hydrolase